MKDCALGYYAVIVDTRYGNIVKHRWCRDCATARKVAARWKDNEISNPAFVDVLTTLKHECDTVKYDCIANFLNLINEGKG